MNPPTTTQPLGFPDPYRARMFAAVAHGSQTYNDEVPYTEHIDRVVDVLEDYGFTDPVIQSAGYLHDVIEDTNRSYGDILKRFGSDVAELVYAVTSELGRNRKERNQKTYPKISGNLLATALKLADRIANVNYGMAHGGKDDMYRNEYGEFRAALFRPKHIESTLPFEHEENEDAIERVNNYLASERRDQEESVQRMWKYLDRVIGK